MKQQNFLDLERCPYCQVAKPKLELAWWATSKAYDNSNLRSWYVYQCNTCGGMVLTCAPGDSNNSKTPTYDIKEIFPTPKIVHETVPDRANHFLTQAIASIHAPAGAVMLTASSIDAMLKEKGYKVGNLFSRIDKAAKDHLITQEMALWAHEIRLDANEQRHADEEAPLPNEADAQRGIEFAEALAQFLFVLPARVASGRRNVEKEAEES